MIRATLAAGAALALAGCGALAALDRQAADSTCSELWAAHMAAGGGVRGLLAARAVERESCYAEDYYDAL